MTAEFYRKLAAFAGVDVFLYEGNSRAVEETERAGDAFTGTRNAADAAGRTAGRAAFFPANPLARSEGLRRALAARADAQPQPVIFRDENEVYFCCCKTKEEQYLMWGPVCAARMDRAALHRFYKSWGIRQEEEKHPVVLPYFRILFLTGIFSELAQGRAFPEEELLRANGLSAPENPETEIFLRGMEAGSDEMYHHTYQEEMLTLNCVREGRLDDIEEYMERLELSAGRLSAKDFNHNKNLAICAVTLFTRAAIEGGVSPADAYRLSDLYINRIDRALEVSEILENRKQSLYEFTKMAADAGRRKKGSGYVEKCRDYIHKNFHGKISLSEAASAIGVSESYLSRIFKEETGMQMQEYVLRFRVERAKNLLKYSEASLAEIAGYVGFSSQSRFGEVFRRYEQMTPREYRERWKPGEFVSGKVADKR